MFCSDFIITRNKIKETVIIVLRTSIFDLRKKTTSSVRFQMALVDKKYNEEEL